MSEGKQLASANGDSTIYLLEVPAEAKEKDRAASARSGSPGWHEAARGRAGSDENLPASFTGD